MSWAARAAVLRCDTTWHDGSAHRSCPAAIPAASQGAALRLAAAAKWFRGRRGGVFIDRCQECSRKERRRAQ